MVAATGAALVLPPAAQESNHERTQAATTIWTIHESGMVHNHRLSLNFNNLTLRLRAIAAPCECPFSLRGTATRQGSCSLTGLYHPTLPVKSCSAFRWATFTNGGTNPRLAIRPR